MGTDERISETDERDAAARRVAATPEPGHGILRRGWRRVRRLAGRIPRSVRTGVLALLGVLVVCVVLGGVSALSARRHLLNARDELRQGRSELLRGDDAGARAAFGRAGAEAARASGDARAPWLRVIGVLPYVGRTADALSAITEAGELTVDAGVELAEAIEGLPDGLGSLAPVAGTIPIDSFRDLEGPLQRADALSAEALELVHDAPATLIPGAVADARLEAESELQKTHLSLQAASRIVGGLPGFLGEDGTRRYYFGAENPAEMRGTGGLIGAYAILTVKNGSFEFSKFGPVQDLPVPRIDRAPSPSEQFSRNYDRFRAGTGFWLNVNMTPDFPLAAQAILLDYQAAVGEKLDGVITADPFALEALLEVTGPQFAPAPVDLQINADNVVAFTANEAYEQFPHPDERKLILGAVAEQVVTTFLEESNPSQKRLRVLADTMAQGHINVYSAHQTMQQGLAATGVGGALPPRDGDFLSVVQNNGGGNKVDFYERRSITYAVDLLGDGAARARVDVAIHNEAPTKGPPRYVIGPFKGIGTVAGENKSIQSVYCATGCELERVEENGEPSKARVGRELDYRFFSSEINVLSGETGTVSTSLVLPNAWEGNSSGGRYRLTFLNQTSIEPTELRVEIRPPEGMSLTLASEGLREEGDLVVYEGIPGRDLVLELRFAPPLPVRWWRNLTRPLSSPLFGL